MPACRHEKDGMVYYTSTLFDSYEIPHFFAARWGGVSRGAFASLNVSCNRLSQEGTPDDPAQVAENCRRAFSIFNRPLSCCAMMRQIHSSRVMPAETSLDRSFAGEGFPSCDGLITQRGNRIDALGVKTADCVPVLLYDLDSDIACALHAGWRGSVADICGKAVEQIRKASGSRGQLAACIGPCIGPCCYEVNRQVADACGQLTKEEFSRCFPRRYEKQGEEKFRADLREINRVFLLRAGLSAENIDLMPLCTACSGGDFFSHRASGGFSGTQLSAVARRR